MNKNWFAPNRLLQVVLVLCMSFVLAGCFIRPYKFTLYQGNAICEEKLAQIRPGMSKEQVRYVLGTPVLDDVFHTQRWDYVYIEKPGYTDGMRQHVAIFFDEGRVERIIKDPVTDYS